MSQVKGAMRGTTIYDIGKDIYATEGKAFAKDTPSIVENLKPVKRTLTEGYHVLKPDELAALLVPRLEISEDKIHGFQRPTINRQHVSKIAKSMLLGKVMPAVELADHKNSLWTVDGQHRVLGAILANMELPVLVRKMDAERMKDLFADQSKGVNVNPNILVLSASDPVSQYVQEAVTHKNDHIWGKLVGENSSQNRISPKQMYSSVGRYVSSTVSGHWDRNIETIEWDEELADELGQLFLAFGTKKTNPAAFRPVGINAITKAAVFIIRRQDSRTADINRWKTWMPNFDFSEYLGMNRATELAYWMIRHWNKRLSPENKLSISDEMEM